MSREQPNSSAAFGVFRFDTNSGESRWWGAICLIVRV